MTEMDKSVAEKLRELRGTRSRECVARALGISVSAVTMYERGERVPRDDVKIKIADYYNKSVQEIFFDQKCHI
jgi:DNA-binding XRE family transcriptional regulator